MCAGVAPRVDFVREANDKYGKQLVDWTLRGVACRLLVREMPDSLDELIAESVAVEPWHSARDVRTIRRQLGDTPNGYFVDATRTAEEGVRALAGELVRSMGWTPHEIAKHPSLEPYGVNATSRVRYLDRAFSEYGIEVVETCTPEGPPELTPDAVGYANPIWCVHGITAALAVLSNMSAWHLVAPLRYAPLAPEGSWVVKLGRCESSEERLPRLVLMCSNRSRANTAYRAMRYQIVEAYKPRRAIDSRVDFVDTGSDRAPHWYFGT